MSYYAKVNLLFGCLLTIITSIISYKSCAQGQRPLSNGCRLLEMEDEINQFEKQIEEIYSRIDQSNDRSRAENDKEKPASVWKENEGKVRKPSAYLRHDNCQNRNIPEHEYILDAFLEEVKNRLKTAREKESNLVNNRSAVTIHSPMRSTPPPLAQPIYKELEEIPTPLLGLPQTGKSEADTAAEKFKNTPAIPKPKPVVKKIDIEQLDQNFGYRSAFFKGKDYKCVVVNPRSESYGIDFLWRDRNEKVLGSFGRAYDFLKSQKKTPVMLMNAGIFDERHAPLGLFYSNTKKIRKLNTKKGEGNFFLEPSGVFIINRNGTARVITKEAYLGNLADTINIRHATQSGPMLVINGDVHPEFRENSLNQTIRNGVGILPDGRIVFIISTEPVNLYEFAQIFRDGLGCKNALYLDGTISKLYLPQLNMQPLSGDFSGIIAVYKTN